MINWQNIRSTVTWNADHLCSSVLAIAFKAKFIVQSELIYS